MPILIYILRSNRWFFFALLLGASLRPLAAEPISAPEYKIKAAFLYNFAVLTEWPTTAFKSPNSPLVIGVLGKDPFGRLLDETMRGKKIHGRKIEVKRFDKVNEDDLKKCHVLFISASEESRTEAIFSVLKNQPILTVGDIDRFNYLGGMIWVKKVNDELKFRIRRRIVDEASLKLSSKLLALSINASVKSGKKTP